MKVKMTVTKAKAKEIYDLWKEKDKEYYAHNLVFAWLGKEGIPKIGAPEWCARKGFNTTKDGKQGCWIRSSGTWVSVDTSSGEMICSGSRHSLQEIMPDARTVITWSYIETSERGWTPWENATTKLRPMADEYGGVARLKDKSEGWHAANGTPLKVRRYVQVTSF